MVKYYKVIGATKKALLGLHEIIKATNLKQTHVKVILSDLLDQHILNEVMIGRQKKYFFNVNAAPFDYTYAESFKKVQRDDLQEMIRYTNSTSCRMQFLCHYLGDTIPSICEICDNDTHSHQSLIAMDDIAEKLSEFRDTYFPILEVETVKSNIVNGVAGSYYGFSNVGSAIHRCKYEGGGGYPDWLVALTVKAFRKHFGKQLFDILLYVPPTESGDLVRNFAVKMSSLINIPISHGLIKTEPTQPQKMLQSGITKKDNVHGKFIFTEPQLLVGKRILLIDDIFDSGYTVKEIGLYLTALGATRIVPVVIAKTLGGDIA